jgi:hypothetical protein
MKIHPISRPLWLTLTLTASLLISFPSSVQAQEEEKKPAAPEEQDDGKSDEQKEKEAQEKDLKQVRKMLQVFRSLEGEWTGSEKITYNKELPALKDKKEKEWKDEWKGFYTQDGRFFEMTGKSDGDLSSTYHWYVTYDSENEEYRAWNFGSHGFSEYTGELSDDGKAVVWSKVSEGEEVDVEDTFELRGDGNRCTAKGETKIISKDGRTTVNYAEQNSTYTRKKIEI